MNSGVSVRERIRPLFTLKLGVSEKHAVSVGMNRKGYWQLAKNEGHECRPVECVSQKAGAYINQNTVEQDLLSGYDPIIFRELSGCFCAPEGSPLGGDPARRMVWGLGEKIPRLPDYKNHARNKCQSE